MMKLNSVPLKDHMPQFQRTIDITLNKAELESMIKDYLKLPNIAKINFVLGYAPSHPMDRHSTQEFSHAKATYVETV